MFSVVFPATAALPFCSAQRGTSLLVAGLTTDPSRSFTGTTLSKNQDVTSQPKQSCFPPPCDRQLSLRDPDNSRDPHFSSQREKAGRQHRGKGGKEVEEAIPRPEPNCTG